MTQWIEPQPVNVPGLLREAVGGHPLVAETLARRGILTPQAARAFLDPGSYTPALPTDLPDLADAVQRIRLALDRGERIAVWGDFDADGQTATALLLESLRSLHANVTFHVPGRNEGHGLHGAGLERLAGEGVRLVLTCDTGIGAHDAVTRANELGLDVVITDHHLLPDTTPEALALVNPHRLAPGHPLRNLTGVGVAYELALELDPKVAGGSLDLVALGTVADVGILVDDARYLVQKGLAALRRTERPGLQVLYETNKLQPLGLTEEHIGFVLAPRFNALGRLADASHGVELLTTHDRTRARILAIEMEGLNARRQLLTKQVTSAALAQIERQPALLSDYHAVVLSHSTWPSGIVGIVAGRLAERFGKPVVLISAPDGKAMGPQAETARGSARSVPGVNLIEALTECAALLGGYGGHSAAAGFSIDPDRIPELRASLSRAVAFQVETIPEPTIVVDAYVELPDLELDLVADLSRLAPFGQGNPALTLCIRELRALSETVIGRTSEHRRVTVEDNKGHSQTVLWWYGAQWPMPVGRFDLALNLRASDFRGIPEVQVEWIDARVLEPAPVEVKTAPLLVVRDFRSTSASETVLQAILDQGGCQVWAEATGADHVWPDGPRARTRLELVPGPRLLIWFLPPGYREMQAAMDAVQPQEVVLFAHDPGMDEIETYLRRLGGLVNYALGHLEGKFDLNRAAARTAQRVAVIRAGLEWLVAKGKISLVTGSEDLWLLDAGGGRAYDQEVEAAQVRLEALLAETAAYRAYAKEAPADALLSSYTIADWSP